MKPNTRDITTCLLYILQEEGPLSAGSRNDHTMLLLITAFNLTGTSKLQQTPFQRNTNSCTIEIPLLISQQSPLPSAAPIRHRPQFGLLSHRELRFRYEPLRTRPSLISSRRPLSEEISVAVPLRASFLLRTSPHQFISAEIRSIPLRRNIGSPTIESLVSASHHSAPRPSLLSSDQPLSEEISPAVPLRASFPPQNHSECSAEAFLATGASSSPPSTSSESPRLRLFSWA
jgi:hypothetical protein